MTLTIEDVSKSFGPVQALSRVSATFEGAQIQAVIGENGAGKSTLMDVISGFVMPDAGIVKLDGRAMPVGNPFEIKRLGIEMVHQHFTLVPAFSAAENLALARVERLYSRADTAQLSGASLALANELGWDVEPEAKAFDLPVGAQQRLEILKALAGNAKFVIFDEPTAVLSEKEVDDLFRVLRRLKEQGKGIVLIAHKLKEVLRIADRVTVLRKGRKVAEAAAGDVSEAQLSNWMVGEAISTAVAQTGSSGLPALEISDLVVLGNRGEEAVRGVTFRVASGEIFGLGGVDGNGQVELAETLACVRSPKEGQVSWHGRNIRETRLKLGYVPQDRQSDGLALTMSVLDNLLIEGHRKNALRIGPFLLSARIRRWTQRLIARFQIAVSHVSDSVGALSGGNQQKVVVARALDENPELLIVVGPTRGLDIAATHYVHAQILSARSSGAAVVLFSTDLEELKLLSDRMVFMSRGEFSEGPA